MFGDRQSRVERTAEGGHGAAALLDGWIKIVLLNKLHSRNFFFLLYIGLNIKQRYCNILDFDVCILVSYKTPICAAH